MPLLLDCSLILVLLEVILSRCIPFAKFRHFFVINILRHIIVWAQCVSKAAN